MNTYRTEESSLSNESDMTIPLQTSSGNQATEEEKMPAIVGRVGTITSVSMAERPQPPSKPKTRPPSRKIRVKQPALPDSGRTEKTADDRGSVKSRTSSGLTVSTRRIFSCIVWKILINSLLLFLCKIL